MNTIGPGIAILTPEGGIAVQMINKTGGPSVKGTIVDSDPSVDFAVRVCPANNSDATGVIYQDGIPDGKPVFVVVSGMADVLLQDGTASTRGYWIKISATQAGRADMTNPNPPGSGTIAEIDNHFREIGHCIQSKLSGTDVLARASLHFN